jgi:hypothetical protein
MSFASFVPEVWSAELLLALQKTFVFQVLSNRNYEGEIANAGDTVHITSVSDPTINSYSQGTSLTYEQLSTADRTLVIDQAKSFSFEIDDIDKRQAAGTVMSEAMQRAAYKMADLVDQALAAVCTGAQAANQIANTSITSADLAYRNILKLSTALDVANVQKSGRKVILPPWYIEVLMTDQRFTAASFSGQPSVAVAGPTALMRVAGFDVYESNNLTSPGSNRNLVVAGVDSAITYAEQINQVEALRLQTTFADAVRGLHLYGAKLLRPDSIATLDASSV